MRSQVKDLVCLSFSARESCDARLRERVTLSREQQNRLLPAWISQARTFNPEAGLLFLGTCHRVEVYAIGVSPAQLSMMWQKEVGPLAAQAKVRRGEDALKHLFRVASSLESEVLGETQITGQLKEAAEWSRPKGLLKGPLDRTLQNALKIAKKVRSETRLGFGVVSVAHVAVDGLLDVFESLEGKSVLLIGAGAMARQALDRLQKHGVSQVT